MNLLQSGLLNASLVLKLGEKALVTVKGVPNPTNANIMTFKVGLPKTDRIQMYQLEIKMKDKMHWRKEVEIEPVANMGLPSTGSSSVGNDATVIASTFGIIAVSLTHIIL